MGSMKPVFLILQFILTINFIKFSSCYPVDHAELYEDPNDNTITIDHGFDGAGFNGLPENSPATENGLEDPLIKDERWGHGATDNQEGVESARTNPTGPQVAVSGNEEIKEASGGKEGSENAVSGNEGIVEVLVVVTIVDPEPPCNKTAEAGNEGLEVSESKNEEAQVENPVSQNRHLKSVDTEIPALEKSTHENLAVEYPIIDNPTAERPVHESPNPENPPNQDTLIEDPVDENLTDKDRGKENPSDENSKLAHKNPK